MLRWLILATAAAAWLLTVPSGLLAEENDDIYRQFQWRTHGDDGDDSFAYPFYYHGPAGYVPAPYKTQRPATVLRFATPYHYNPYDSPFYPPYWKATTYFGYYGYNWGTHYAPYHMHTGLSIGPATGSRILAPVTGY